MALDTLAVRERQITLLDQYAALLTEHQRAVLDLHLRRDWSLAEIAQWQGTSRAAVHDLIRRALDAMEDYERRLGLVAGRQRRESEAASLRREVLQLGRRLERLEARLRRV